VLGAQRTAINRRIFFGHVKENTLPGLIMRDIGAHEREPDALLLTTLADIGCRNFTVLHQTKKLRKIILGKRLLLKG